MQSLGAISLVLLFFAAAAYGLTRELSLFVLVNAVAGIFAFAGWLAAGRETVGAFLGERSTRYGANAILYSVLFVGILVMANVLAARYSVRWDTTEADVYSLSPQSAQLVKDLDGELDLLAFVEGGIDPALRDLFESYAHESKRVSYRLVDPDKSPDLAERYNVTTYNTVRVAYGEQATLVTQPSEESITNAIVKVTQGEKKTICLVEGHGEPGADDLESPRGYGVLKRAIESENYGFQTLLLATEQEPPNEKCDLLLVAAPVKDWLEPEIVLLRSYLERGGRGIFLFAANRGADVREVLAGYGFEVGENVVVDQVLRLFQGPALGVEPMAESYGAHPITENFKERTIFPLARTVSAVKPAPEGVTVTEIVKTSRSSWAESDVEGLFQRSEATLDPSTDRKGPLSIAAAATVDVARLENAESDSRLVAFGSDQFVNNKNINNLFNRDLILNAIGWAVGEEQLVAIRARTVRASAVQLTDAQVDTIFYLSVLVLPELLLLAGIAVWARRRNA